MDIYPVFCYKVDNVNDNFESVADCSTAEEALYNCKSEDSSSIDNLFSNKADQLSGSCLSDSITVDDIKPDVLLNSSLQGSTSSDQTDLLNEDNLQSTFQNDENKPDHYEHLSGDTQLYCIVKDEKNYFPDETEISTERTQPDQYTWSDSQEEQLMNNPLSDEGNTSSVDGIEANQSSPNMNDSNPPNYENIQFVGDSEDLSVGRRNKAYPVTFQKTFKKIGCLYRCLSLGMFKDESKHRYIRSHITSNIINHWDYYGSVVSEYHRLYDVDIKNAVEYERFVSSGKSTGSCLELSVATRIFNIYIELVNSESGMIERYGTTAVGKRKIFLLFRINSLPSFDYIFESPCSQDHLKSGYEGHSVLDFSRLLKGQGWDNNKATRALHSSNNNKDKNNCILQKVKTNKSKRVTNKLPTLTKCYAHTKNDAVHELKSSKMQMKESAKSTNGILKIIPKSLRNSNFKGQQNVILANINGKTVGIVPNLTSSNSSANRSKRK